MTIVADAYRYVVGVDTHAKTHTYAIINTHTGTVTSTDTFPTSPAGMKRALSWIQRRTDGPTLTVIECVGSHGARLAALATNQGHTVVEASPHAETDAGRSG